jgi:hypothetical protein
MAGDTYGDFLDNVKATADKTPLTGQYSCVNLLNLLNMLNQPPCPAHLPPHLNIVGCQFCNPAFSMQWDNIDGIVFVLTRLSSKGIILT